VIDSRNRRGRRADDGAVETGAEQCVDDDVRLGKRAGPRRRYEAGGARQFERVRGVADDAPGVADQDQIDVQPSRARQCRDDETVAAVVSRPADDADPACVGPASTQFRKRRRGGALHQCETGDAEGRDGVTIERARAIGVVEQGRRRQAHGTGSLRKCVR